jgi:hypothetical protein
VLLLQPPPQHPADEEQHPVIAVKRPRQPDTGGRRDPISARREHARQHSEYDPDDATDHHRPDLHLAELGDTLRQPQGDRAPGLGGGRSYDWRSISSSVAVKP